MRFIIIWRLNDWGFYKRRHEAFARELAKRDEVESVLHIEHISFKGLIYILYRWLKEKDRSLKKAYAEQFDEPFSGLDPVNQHVFKNAIVEMKRVGATVIFSTHQLETAERLCEAIALINKGELVLYGPLGEVKAGFGMNSVLLEFEGDGAFLKALPGVARIDDYGRWVEIRLHAGADSQSILTAAAGRLKVLKFEIVAPTLHNIFIEKVGAEGQPLLERVGDA